MRWSLVLIIGITAGAVTLGAPPASADRRGGKAGYGKMKTGYRGGRAGKKPRPYIRRHVQYKRFAMGSRGWNVTLKAGKGVRRGTYLLSNGKDRLQVSLRPRGKVNLTLGSAIVNVSQWRGGARQTGFLRRSKPGDKITITGPDGYKSSFRLNTKEKAPRARKVRGKDKVSKGHVPLKQLTAGNSSVSTVRIIADTYFKDSGYRSGNRVGDSRVFNRVPSGNGARPIGRPAGW